MLANRHQSALLNKVDSSGAPRHALTLVILGFIQSSHYNSQNYQMSERDLLEQISDLCSVKDFPALFGCENIGSFIESLVKQHYLVKVCPARTPPTLPPRWIRSLTLVRAAAQEKDNSGADGAIAYVFSVGPRAIIEIGRKQIACFSYEVAGMRPDLAALSQEFAAVEEEA